MATDYCLHTNYREEKEVTADTSISKLKTADQVQPASAPETSRYNVGRVRQLFEERRKQTAKKKPAKGDYFRSTIIGRDKSYPLQPLRRDPTANNFVADDRKNYDLRFDELDTPIDQHTADLVKVSSWPTISSPFDPGIFGRLPNLGGKLLSERRKVIAEAETFTARTTNFVPSGTMSSRIPTKISTLNPVAKLTDGVSRLSTNSSRTLNHNVANGTRRQPVQKNFLTPVRSTQTVTTDERKLVPSIPTSRQPTNTSRVPETSRLNNTSRIRQEASQYNVNKVQEAQKPLVNGETTPAVRKSTAASSNLPSCKICGRHFAEDRIKRHQEICEKSTKKKRKVFDPMKHRLKGTEAEGLINKIKATTKNVPPSKKTNWRQRHEEFLENIREARKVKQHLAKGGKLSDLPPPKPLDTSDYVQCPHCNRKFNEGAAERHIPKCVNMRHNKPKNPPSRRAPPAASNLSRTTKPNVTRKR